MTLQEQHNILQRALALKYLRLYNRKLVTKEMYLPDTALLASLEKVVSSGQQLRRFSTLHREASRVRRILEEESNDTIEVILNTHGRHTEIILPIKTTDLAGGLPTDELYEHCQGIADEYGADEEELFEDYIVLRMEKGIDKRDVARDIVSKAPLLFGGSLREQGKYKLRVASNFAFTYRYSVADEPESIEEKVRSERRDEDISPDRLLREHASRRALLTREEAIWYLEQGITTLQLRTFFSETEAMSIAGWASAHTKGYYDSHPIDAYKPKI